MPNVGSYFQKTFNTISDYIPPIPFVSGDYDDDDDDSEDNDRDKYTDTDDTTENTSIRRPKFKYSLRRPIFKLTNPLETNGTQQKRKRWYDKFFFGSEEETSTTVNPVESTTEQSKFLNWLGMNKDLTTERSVPIPITSTTTKS